MNFDIKGTGFQDMRLACDKPMQGNLNNALKNQHARVHCVDIFLDKVFLEVHQIEHVRPHNQERTQNFNIGDVNIHTKYRIFNLRTKCNINSNLGVANLYNFKVYYSS